MLLNAVVLGLLLSQTAAPPATRPSPVSPDETAEIRGTLVDKDTGEPVAGVALGLMGYGGGEGDKVTVVGISVRGKFPPEPATTDSLGRFVFSGLKEGDYLILPKVGGINQMPPIMFTRDGVSTPDIRVKRGESLDIGKVSVAKRK